MHVALVVAASGCREDQWGCKVQLHHLVSEPRVSSFESSSSSSCVTSEGEDALPGKLCDRRQEGDGHGAEAIAVRSSSSMSESSTRCVINGNMEAGHRQVAAPVMNMCESSRRCVIDDNMEESHRRAAAPEANMRQRACHGGTLAVKA